MKFSPGGSGVVTEEQMKLFVSEGNPHCLKAVAALEVTGVKCDVQYVSHEGKTAWLSLWRASLLVLVAHDFRLTCDRWPLGVFLVVLDTSTFSHLCLWKGAELRLAAVRRVAVLCHWWMESAAGHLKQLENSNVRCYCVVLPSYECSYPQPLSVFVYQVRVFFFLKAPH